MICRLNPERVLERLSNQYIKEPLSPSTIKLVGAQVDFSAGFIVCMVLSEKICIYLFTIDIFRLLSPTPPPSHWNQARSPENRPNCLYRKPWPPYNTSRLISRHMPDGSRSLLPFRESAGTTPMRELVSRIPSAEKRSSG